MFGDVIFSHLLVTLPLFCRNKLDRELVKELLSKAETVEAYLPAVETLKDFIGKADDWKAKAVCILVRIFAKVISSLALLFQFISLIQVGQLFLSISSK